MKNFVPQFRSRKKQGKKYAELAAPYQSDFLQEILKKSGDDFFSPEELTELGLAYKLATRARDNEVRELTSPELEVIKLAYSVSAHRDKCLGASCAKNGISLSRK